MDGDVPNVNGEGIPDTVENNQSDRNLELNNDQPPEGVQDGIDSKAGDQ